MINVNHEQKFSKTKSLGQNAPKKRISLDADSPDLNEAKPCWLLTAVRNMTILARVLEVSKESTEDKDLDLSESPSVEGCLQPGTVCHSVVQNRQTEWGKGFENSFGK